MRERLAFQIFHHQIINAVLLADVEECADVRMIQAGNSARFALESFAQFGTIRKMRRQNFDGDDAVEPRVARAVHLTHPARADRGENFIWAESSSGRHAHYFFPVGTFCFNSSNQFSTTLICVGAASADSLGLSIRN